ncbi:hypothetical protein [Asticcacaulis taihuensis]|uniref:Uncharacterized protein n=1 Tax=Asticcacaulis taihuensis TaxID=260084 RepID=A0A1G4SQA8_9CAUL|nr:hypothetical protein [Asticcacaulis taihuensis]SCW71191.1 hypothetical protein SAMN02927928_2811 [Asticcacaulis taihuensis]
MDKFATHNPAFDSGALGLEINNLAWLEDEWDDEHLARIEGGELGYAREELRLAETLFSRHLPDDILLRLYLFVMSHGDDEPGIWSLIRDKTKRLILSRLSGGPKKRAAKYKRGFDPKDHQLAVEAISKNALPYRDLLSLYDIASINQGIDEDWNDDAVFAAHWEAIFDLLGEKILTLMAAHRADIQGVFNQKSSGLNDAAMPRIGSGDA